MRKPDADSNNLSNEKADCHVGLLCSCLTGQVRFLLLQITRHAKLGCARPMLA